MPPRGLEHPAPEEFEQAWFLTRRFLPKVSVSTLQLEQAEVARPKAPPRGLLATGGSH